MKKIFWLNAISLLLILVAWGILVWVDWRICLAVFFIQWSINIKTRLEKDKDTYMLDEIIANIKGARNQ